MVVDPRCVISSLPILILLLLLPGRGRKGEGGLEVLTKGQLVWRERYCGPRNCEHSYALTWLCIEKYLAQFPGSSQLIGAANTQRGLDAKVYELAEDLDDDHRRFVAHNADVVLSVKRPRRRGKRYP